MKHATRNTLLWVAAMAVLLSGWVHFSLYFRGGYRGIAPEAVLGMTISRSFALNALAGLVIAEVLVLATRFDGLALPAAVVGVGFGVATLVAYFLSRTTGVLGFEETTTSNEAVVAMVSEVILVLTLVPVALDAVRSRRPTRAPSVAPAG